jgi:phytoene dehydrogenase-like protein
MGKRVIVIGSGLAGLSAGVYAQKSGFDVTILESHSIAGGICTSWKRKGYHIEGAMHWLTGSNKNEPLYRLWKHIGALNDNIPVRYPEPFREYYHKGTPIRLYRNVDLTEKHLIELSPSDEKEIRLLCNNIRKVKKLVMPIMDIKGVKVTKRNRPSLRLLCRVLSANRAMRKSSKIPKEEYIKRFKHEGLRELFTYIIGGKYSATWLYFSLGTQARGDGGFPEGGSKPFVSRIVNTFKEAGGEIVYNTRATRVVTENGKAVGVEVNGEILPADAVIVTADAMQMDHLFDTPPQAQWLDEMREKTKPTMCTFVSLGIDADLKKYQKDCIFKLDKPIKVANAMHNYLAIYNYANDPMFSPEGKAVVTMLLISSSYDFWKEAKESGRYAEEKEKVAANVIEALSAQMPEIAGKVEFYDVATPLTYERYSGNWKGSWMTMMAHSIRVRAYPPVVSNISGVYFAGHRMRAPGGMPVSAMSGRTAVQYLCRDTETLFVSEE